MNIKYRSYVYILPLSDESAFKIGKSSSPIDRISILQKFYEFDMSKSLLFECSCSDEAYEVEMILHKVFFNSKIKKDFDGGNEFYSVSVLENVIELIDSISKERGIKKKKIYIKNNIYNVTDIEKYAHKLLIDMSDTIRTKRISMNATRDEISISSGVSLGTIKRIERGKNTSLLNILKVLYVLGLNDVLTLSKTEINGRKRVTSNGYKIID